MDDREDRTAGERPGAPLDAYGLPVIDESWTPEARARALREWREAATSRWNAPLHASSPTVAAGREENA